MRNPRFEVWFSHRNGISLNYVRSMWNGATYTSCDYHIELAWAAWNEAINGVNK